MKEVSLENNTNNELDLNEQLEEVSFSSDNFKGGGETQDNNIVNFDIENNSDMEVKIDLGLNDVDITELNYDKAKGSENLNVDENPVNVSNSSVKVIKIDADPNTLNMINK